MHFQKIGFSEYDDYTCCFIMHEQKFTRQEFIVMYNEAIEEIQKEENCAYVQDMQTVVDKLCEKFGFKEVQEDVELWARDEKYHPIINEDDINGDDRHIDVSDQKEKIVVQESEPPQVRILMQFKSGNTFYPVIGTQEQVTEEDIQYVFENGTRTKVNEYLEEVKVEGVTPESYRLILTILRDCIRIDLFVKDIPNGDVIGAVREHAARSLAKAADDEFVEWAKRNNF
jgi:hypothetical protein